MLRRLRDLLAHDRAIIAILAISGTIAFIAPFDRYFAALTLGSSGLRAVAMAGIALIGAWHARTAGLALTPVHRGRSVAIGALAAVAVAGWVGLLDAWLFRALLPRDYLAFMHLPLAVRLLYFMQRAFNENVIYRLFVFGGLMALVTRLRGGRAAPLGLVLALALVTQSLNIGYNVVALAAVRPGALMLGYIGLRFVAPGLLWAVLYWREGFLTAEIASIGCHVVLQPLAASLF